MALPLTTLLKSVDDKVAELSAIHVGLKARIKSLEDENALLSRKLEETEMKLRQAETDSEFLTMSHRLADSPDSIISARRRIARLIRTIDNCISMLKDE